jgi:hypothetical protein
MEFQEVLELLYIRTNGRTDMAAREGTQERETKVPHNSAEKQFT